MLLTVDFFGAQVTRMIIGDNPVNGHSYIQDTYSGEEMRDYYTPEKTLEMLFRAEEEGFNTLLPLACPNDFDVLRKYRSMGGKLKLIFQPFPAVPLERNIEEMMAFDPIAIYHQGTTTDYLVETGQLDVLARNLELIRATGLPVGLCSHDPETILRAEREDWGVDFYMACLYDARINRKGTQSGFITGETKAGLVFRPDDRFLMYDVIQKTAKPFIAYKILAGGQIFAGKSPDEYPEVIESCFAEVYTNIKPGDLTCVGVFQRDKDQLGQNARILAKILGK